MKFTVLLLAIATIAGAAAEPLFPTAEGTTWKYDWIQENGSKVHEVGEFQFSKATSQRARWVLAVPEDSPIRGIVELTALPQVMTVATHLPDLSG